MQRRQFLQKSVPLAVGVGAAGCTDSSTDSSSAGYATDEIASNEGNAWDDSDTAESDGSDPALEAPPRESEVFEAIESGDRRETVVVTFEANPVVQARIGSGTTTTTMTTHTDAENTTTRTTVESTTTTDEESSRTWMDSLSPDSLLPVGVAAGRGRGGRSGGGRSGRGGRSGSEGGSRGSGRGGRSSGGKSGKSGGGKKGKNGKGKSKNGSGKGDGKRSPVVAAAGRARSSDGTGGSSGTAGGTRRGTTGTTTNSTSTMRS
ncbi:hypothetical protein BG842_01310 [Haladaptatus sp. W1]|uniref:hypothetical protein n=1 Tax=Haladaptatus sp. W1 TaxID=1897478 RepID=UPI000849799B|nr:hypothetical protein [Haladaptatus sp. W1]ODR82379.1 hypothetical protein BG842_01310 [Haladaptatus sp. W1]